MQMAPPRAALPLLDGKSNRLSNPAAVPPLRFQNMNPKSAAARIAAVA
jgi:hypothetical protein